MPHYRITDTIAQQHPLLKQYPKLIAQLLVNRNITTSEEADAFLHPQYEHTHDPFLLYGMEKAVTRIHTAIENKEHITIYADYDADGIPGAVILAELFDKLGYQNYDIYIPHRHNEGYGVHIDALENIAEAGTKLIITIDVGIAAHEAGDWCYEHGIDLMITDHHLPGVDENGKEMLPLAYALINPKQSLCHYPDDMLCGCGVAFKMIQAFVQRYGEVYNIHEGWEKWLLDMVGIATISDLVPLRNENRILSYYGLKVIKKTRRRGLKQLVWDAGITMSHLTEENIAFGITPKINAASRMSHPEDAVAVFRAQDDVSAKASVQHLIRLNNQRKQLVARTVKEAYKKLEQQGTERIIVIGSPNWQAGILGIVAAKLVEKFHVPVFVWSEEHGVIKGSCRTYNGTHLVELMKLADPETFIQFGGHAEAGGFSCEKREVHFLSERLHRAAEQYHHEQDQEHEDVIMIDGELTLDDVHQETFDALSQLAPFGVDNERPAFIFKGVIPEYIGQFGKAKEHCEIHFKNSKGNSIRAIAFFKSPEDFQTTALVHKPIDIVAHVESSLFMGKHELRLALIDCLQVGEGTLY